MNRIKIESAEHRCMSTKRKKASGTSSEGFHYVGGIVTGANCIFQKIDQENDQGNDAYIEFISKEVATSLLVLVQIKSGTSFRRKGGYAIPANRDHFSYWSNGPVPVVGIVYDPERKLAVWIHISEFLRSHSNAIENGPYVIPVPAENEFNDETFEAFKQRLISYNYSSDSFFGRSLEYFADTENQQRCLIGMRSLFAYHRNRKATWFYLIHSFRSTGGTVANQLMLLLGHLPSNPFMFWHGDNTISPEIEKHGKNLLVTKFGREEVLKLLGHVDAHGFAAGSVGYVVSTIVFAIREAQAILEDLAFDMRLSEELRANAMFLLIHYAQFHSVEFAINAINRYVAEFSETEDCDLFLSMKETLEKEGFLGYIGT
jgi:hypothetical protein